MLGITVIWLAGPCARHLPSGVCTVSIQSSGSIQSTACARPVAAGMHAMRLRMYHGVHAKLSMCIERCGSASSVALPMVSQAV